MTNFLMTFDLSVMDGMIRSRVFPGLWLVVDDLLVGNMARALQVLQEGWAATEQEK